jgi:hypothetical protein
MKDINRSAILVRPKEPYLRWASSIDEDAPRQTEILRNRTTVYLVDDLETPAAERRMLRRVFPLIFEAELAAWHLNESDWPQRRDFKAFQEWFAVEIQSEVFDLGSRQIQVDPYEP